MSKTNDPATREPSTADKIAVLKHLVNNHDIAWICEAVQLHTVAVQEIADTYGPDVDRMRWAIDELTATLGVVKATPTRPTRPVRPEPVIRKAGDPRPIANPTRQVKPSADTLIHAAAESPKARTRNVGAKIAALLGDLSARLDADQREREAQAAEAAANEKRRLRIKELEDQMAKAGKELRQLRRRTRTTKTAPALGAPAPAIREWARENGIDCPSRGKVPSAVRDLYDAAHVAA